MAFPATSYDWRRHPVHQLVNGELSGRPLVLRQEDDSLKVTNLHDIRPMLQEMNFILDDDPRSSTKGQVCYGEQVILPASDLVLAAHKSEEPEDPYLELDYRYHDGRHIVMVSRDNLSISLQSGPKRLVENGKVNPDTSFICLYLTHGKIA